MAHPSLAFCPYLPLSNLIQFADWELGPMNAFADRWADPRFKARAEAFLQKFVGVDGAPVESPALLCRRGAPLDGQMPSAAEVEALELAIAFGFLDGNPRNLPENRHRAWAMLTSDNAEPYFWPIDVEDGHVATRTGYMVSTLGGGYTISDPKLVIRPPLDLHMPSAAHSADPLILTAVYESVLRSLQSPGANITCDRLRVAIGWFTKAWRNTATVHYAERLVFLKTAFEALTGTHKSHKSAEALRHLFEAVPDTTPDDSEILVWSPTETAIRTRIWVDSGGRTRSDLVTDLELWFMAFGDARNTIVHEGRVPPLVFKGSNPAYDGHFVFTAEFLLRGVVKVLLSQLGYPDAWRSVFWRAIKAALDEYSKQQNDLGPPGAAAPTAGA